MTSIHPTIFRVPDIADRAERIGTILRRAGTNRFALQADNGPLWAAVDLAARRAGATLLPLPSFFSRSQIAYALESASIDIVIGDRPFAGLPLRGVDEFDVPEQLVLSYLERRVEREPQMPIGTGKITFTSGSTGEPRGVCLSHAQLQRQSAALVDRVAVEHPRHLCLLPLATLLENVAGLDSALHAGGEVCLPSLASLGWRGSSSIDAGKLVSAITELQPSTLILLPQLLMLLVAASRRGWKAPDSLRFIAVGGSRVAPGLLQSAADAGLPVYQGYGLSECASVVSLNTPGENRPGSCGRALPHLRVGVRQGEIEVAGNSMLGYLNDPASWTLPYISTGDLGQMDRDGFLYLLGRRKNLLISSFGRNISPEWVESELLQDPALDEAVVFGDARPFCVAVLTSRGEDADPVTIRTGVDRANARLPDYARVCAWIRSPTPLRELNGLTTANGRPRRDAIYRHFANAIESLYLSEPKRA